MWPHDDLFRRLNGGGFRRYDHDAELVERRHAGGARRRRARGSPPRARSCTAPGCSARSSASARAARSSSSRRAGSTPTSWSTRSSATEAEVAVIVGDPFARPMLESLRANGRATGGSRRCARWSRRARCGPRRSSAACLEFNADDAPRSTRSARPRRSAWAARSSAAGSRHTAEFSLGEDVRVLAEDGPDVVAGSDVPGMLALGGRLPLGYYKDDAKTEATFRVDRRAALLGARATGRRSAPTARSCSSAAAPSASTPPGRRSSPRRSKRR